MKTLLFSAALLAASSTLAAAQVTFVAPLQDSQAIGPGVIEVTTDAVAIDRVEFYVDGSLAGVVRKAPWRTPFDFGTTTAARDITARVLFNGYRDSATARMKTAALTAADSIAVDLVEVPLRIRSKRTITPADLRVHEGSVAQTIREVIPRREPAHFAFIIDRSLSMGDGRLEAALQAVDSSVKLLRGGDSYSITTFNHTIARGEIRLAGVPSRATEQPLVPSGGTSLRDAIAAAMQGSRTYAIVITDGGDRNSSLTEEEALRRISGTRTIVSAIVLGRAAPFLEKAVANTGGTLARSTTQTTVRDAERIIADINSRYTLVYQSQGTPAGWRRIDVASKTRGLEILAARKGYFAR